MTTTLPIYCDCDPGIDDSLALGYLAASPLVRLVGVGSVFGNCPAPVGARNACDWLGLMGSPEVPVAIGALKPSHGEFHGGTPWIHGERGPGTITLPRAETDPIDASAAELIVRLAHEHAGELALVTVGPLTNIALALDLEPELPHLVRSLTLMGGAALHEGNVTPVAEANIFKDPESARRVFEQPWPMTMVGLDVTMEHTLEEHHRERLLSSGRPAPIALAQVLDFYFDFHLGVYGRRCSCVHDPLAAMVAAGGALPLTAPVVTVEVDTTDGPGRGQTICDLRGRYRGFPPQDGAHCQVVLEVEDSAPDHLVDTLVNFL